MMTTVARSKRRKGSEDIRVYTETEPTSTIISRSPQESKIISDALQSIPTKKENLRKSLQDLQFHFSTLSSSFNLQWSDFDSHYSSLQTSLEARLKQQQEDHSSTQPLKKHDPTLPELESFCTKMDGIGLRNCIFDHGARRRFISVLTAAFKSSPDPAKLVINSFQGLLGMYCGDTTKRGRTFVLLLQGVSNIEPEIKPEVKEEAKKLAAELKGKVGAVVYLQMLTTYGLADEFSVDELLDLLVVASRMREAVDLCKGLGLTSKVPDLIKKLDGKGKQLEAVKFIYAFELVDMFPPVRLLESYMEESKKVVQELLDKDVAICREIRYLRSMIFCINQYKLKSQYPRVSLEKRIKELKKKAKKRNKKLKELTVAIAGIPYLRTSTTEVEAGARAGAVR